MQYWHLVWGEARETVSGLKSSFKQNKAGIDVASDHTVSKCMEKPWQEGEPPRRAVLCVQGLGAGEREAAPVCPAVTRGLEDKVWHSIRSKECQKAGESSRRGWPDCLSAGLWHQCLLRAVWAPSFACTIRTACETLMKQASEGSAVAIPHWTLQGQDEWKP